MIRDAFKRPLRDLRISVTDRCNFRCRYCMPSEVFGPDYPFLTNQELLSFDEIVRLAQLFRQLGVQKLRITGGEPLLRPHLPELLTRLNAIPGIEDMALTTNGVLLPQLAAPLRAAGLQRVTVSLDSLDEQRFGAMNGRGIHPDAVLKGIEAALRAGLQVKINMVVQKGANEQDILPMARYFRERGLILRFIEFMDVGNTNGWNMEKVLSKKEIFERIHAEMPLEPLEPNYRGEVATRFRYRGTEQEIGIISSVTDAFCANCTRARLSANGQLYTCLFAEKGFDLLPALRSGVSDQELLARITDVWQNRTDRYSEERLQQTQPKRKIEMSYIGG